ncbi:unnamed protein product [Paramecium octaurelia]|uniref:Uncharacterized protein n=1 Tax=Paramecium octaurelia TaxID=43137 RepID=A0A8S1VS18_PAROT|nr:unnamed protein product [Paramecium octaurelia]
MAERTLDYIEQRNSVRKIVTWPWNFVFGLKSFQTVQHIYNFTARTIFAASSLIPFLTTYNTHQFAYAENSVRLTRYRNYHDDII